jgi:hypothetical protein
MTITRINTIATIFFSVVILSCNSPKSPTENSDIPEIVRKTESILPSSKCDKIIQEYDDLVARSMQVITDHLDGKEVDQAEQQRLMTESKALAEKINKLGVEGLGGQQCYDEFSAIQEKWAKKGMEIQEKAIQKAQEAMKDFGN